MGFYVLSLISIYVTLNLPVFLKRKWTRLAAVLNLHLSSDKKSSFSWLPKAQNWATEVTINYVFTVLTQILPTLSHSLLN